MALFVYLWLKKIINACQNIISFFPKVEIYFVFSEFGIQADCKELEEDKSGRVCIEDKEVSQINGSTRSNGSFLF